MDELQELRQRVARLEAERAALSVFNEYTYYLDVGYPADLVDIFAEDAKLDVINFPPGSMKDLHFSGRDELRGLYMDHSSHPIRIAGGHHTTNVSINVSADATEADLSAYFLTTGNMGVAQGGMYNLHLRQEPDRWRIARMKIMSGWGWRPKEGHVQLTEHLSAEVAERGGKPALWEA